MADRDKRDERLWESGWDAHARAQRRRLAELPFAEKLAWLEEAHALARHLERDRRRPPNPGRPSS